VRPILASGAKPAPVKPVTPTTTAGQTGGVPRAN